MGVEGIQWPAAVSASGWKRRAKLAVGKALERLMPARAARIAAGVLPEQMGWVERAMIASLVERHRRNGTLDELAPLHAWLWRGKQAVTFHEQARSDIKAGRWPKLSVIVEPIRNLVAPADSPYRRLCEIGCGNGLVLEELARALPMLESLTGIDLSEDQISINRRREVDARIRFEAADATEWIPKNGQPGTVYMTNAGVFEYFRRSDLQSLFAHLARSQRPTVVALSEPIPADYDLESETESRPYGFENSVGHNYPLLLREAGFKVCFMESQLLDSRFLLLVAECR